MVAGCLLVIVRHPTFKFPLSTEQVSFTCIFIQGLGTIATATGYVIGSFKLRYPHVHNMADAGEILAGPIGREVLGAAQVIFIVFLCGSHVLTGMIAFDTSESQRPQFLALSTYSCQSPPEHPVLSFGPGCLRLYVWSSHYLVL